MSRNKILAKNLVNYSCNLKKDENILINCTGTSGIPLVKEIIKEVYLAGGKAFVNLTQEGIERELLLGATNEQYNLLGNSHGDLMDKMDAYIGINATKNTDEMSDVPSEKLNIKLKNYIIPVHMDRRVPNTKWVILRYPNESMAQAASMSLEGFEDYFYNVCNLDYSKMSKAMDNLVNLMNKTDKVRIIGEGTDLEFSIKDIPAIKCAGEMNIPDGEVFTAPVKNSVNGKITYNTSSRYDDFIYENISFEFKDGKIIKATGNNTEKLNKILDTDEGGRYIGEFAIGVNPYIKKPMLDTLFDEKIMGSFHLTPGSAYDEADNGNKSAVHWDLVSIQTKEHGGGEIYFDNLLIRKNGIFVIEELESLNPENLI